MSNFAIYDGFISILTEILRRIKPDITRFDAVRLTVPDPKFLWNVSALASVEHFMENCKTDINDDCDNILSLIIARKESFVIDMTKSFHKIYTYQFYEYFHKMFGIIFNIDPENQKGELYDTILQVIRVLCNSPQLDGILQTNELETFLRICYPHDAISDTEIDTWIDNVSICFHKIICAIIFACDGRTDRYKVAPILVSQSEAFKTSLQKIIKKLKVEMDETKEIELYRDLYNLIEGCHEEIQNLVTYKFYKQFFAFVNRADFQDEVLFKNPERYTEIFQLYHMFYINVKFKLYRAYGKNTAKNKGMMRYSLLDRQIVMDYLSKYNKNDDAEYIFSGDDSRRRFIIRLANENDVDNLTRLSNPIPPYRRAIFIRFNQAELAEAITKKQLWIIEEEYMCERILACSAIILYNDNNCGYKTFYAGEMNRNYCKKYYKSGEKLPQKYKYIDFDSIIVDDGRVNTFGRTYRGCGFQRLMLILAEEIAKSKDCDYICATVSSFNKPSERNFMLNGYEIPDNTNYPFEEDDPSPFIKYIESSAANEEIKRKFHDDLEYEVTAYKDILVNLRIAEEDYRRDMNVPREFVVLNIK